MSAPGETLVAVTLVTAASLRRNFRNFRKRYANQDGGLTSPRSVASSIGWSL
jgi:hypothetical protein